MKKLIDEMLSTPAGREALLDAIPRLFDHDKQRRAAASIEDVPIDRIAWSAAHRLNSVPKDVVDKLQNPVPLNRVSINGEVLYLTANGGNHRIERFVEAGRKTIPARVHDWDLASAVLKKGFTTEHRLDIKVADKGALPVPSDDITPAQAELFKALDLVKDESTLAPPPPRKRRILGFGIGD